MGVLCLDYVLRLPRVKCFTGLEWLEVRFCPCRIELREIGGFSHLGCNVLLGLSALAGVPSSVQETWFTFSYLRHSPVNRIFSYNPSDRIAFDVRPRTIYLRTVHI